MRAEVRRIRPEEWPAWRAVRLEALADTPIGFLTQLAEAERWPDAQWQERAQAASAGDQQGLWLAWSGGRPVGCAGGMRRPGQDAVDVIAVYVAPAARGGDLVGRLVEAVQEWARAQEGVRRLRLEVHEDNARARRAYARIGFVETGTSQPYAPDPARRELEMVRPL